MEDNLNKTLTKKIGAEIQAIEAFDDTERAHQLDAIKWLASGVNPFRIKKPDVPPKHLVSYFVLVDPEHKSILLVDHIKAQLWLPSGGHVKFNEHPKMAVIREAEEELNLEAVFLRNNDHPFFITVTPTGGLVPGHTDVSLWYLLRGNVHNFLQYDKSEFTDTEWYTLQEILNSDPVIFDPHLQRFVQKLAAYLL
jgi:8-oxo-dGTP pyrophosphatase MutT (NUDIX family)